MVTELFYVVVITRLLSLALGGRHHVSRCPRLFPNEGEVASVVAFGLALVTIGASIEGALFGILEVNLVHAIESTLNVLGFLLVIYAVRAS